MLVLSRNEGQSIQIGASLVTVVRIRGGQVRIGITAAPEVPIWRDEISPMSPIGPIEWHPRDHAAIAADLDDLLALEGTLISAD